MTFLNRDPRGLENLGAATSAASDADQPAPERQCDGGDSRGLWQRLFAAAPDVVVIIVVGRK